MSELQIERFQERDAAEWKHFLKASDNGTLFHDLDFLAYHPPDRFAFHHLVIRRSGKLLALLPGAITGDGKIFRSPSGASVGGPVTGKLQLAHALELVDALKVYASAQGWQRLDFTLSPHVYSSSSSDTWQFALFARKFMLLHRQLTFMIPLNGAAPGAREPLPSGRMSEVRAARRNGLDAVHGGIELAEPFFCVFRDTYARHGVAPTHSEAEILDLLTRLPDRVEIVMATRGDTPIAGILLLRLNPRIAYTFYICSSTQHSNQHGVVLTLAAAADRLRKAGYWYLDLGPSASESAMNSGVVFFKESLGAAGFSRDRWIWAAS